MAVINAIKVLGLNLWLLPRNVCITLLKLYRRTISPLYGQVCKYYPSCSAYAVTAFQKHGVVLGSVYTTWRLLRCNPFSSGGVDEDEAPLNTHFHLTNHGFVRPTIRKA